MRTAGVRCVLPALTPMETYRAVGGGLLKAMCCFTCGCLDSPLGEDDCNVVLRSALSQSVSLSVIEHV